jgi:hypothetical protein
MYSYKTVCILEKSLNIVTGDVKRTNSNHNAQHALQLVSKIVDFYKQQPVDIRFKNLIYVDTANLYEMRVLAEEASLAADLLIKNVPDTNIFFIKHIHAVLLAELEHLTGTSTLLHLQILHKDFLHNRLDLLQYFFKNAF